MADNMKVYKCRSIVRGSGAGEAVVSKDAMCFYLTDPTTGVVIERNHAIEGKGSSVVQADGFYQLWVRNNLPAAIIINVPEPVIVSSAVMVGSTMVDRLEKDPFEAIEDGDYVEVDADAQEVRVWKGGKAAD